MASKQKQRLPCNIYIEKHAEQEFQEFIQQFRLKSLPISENLLPQATDANHPSSPKRQRYTLLEVCQNFLVFFLDKISFHQPASNHSDINHVPTFHSDEVQSTSIPNANEIANTISFGSTFDHDLRGLCIPDHHPNGSEECGQTESIASNSGSFQPAPLDLDEGELDTGVLISALQVTIKNIRALKNMTLKDGMAPDDVDRLRDPELAHCTLNMSDIHLMKALWHFIYLTNTSCDHYETI